MVLTDDIYLPSEKELKHKELPVTCNYLISSAMWLGKYCDFECKEFMLCRNEEVDPRKCLDYGHKVTDCGMKFFQKVKKTCAAELEWYTKCLDYTAREPELKRCRKEQALFDGCMDKNGFERAHFGYFQLLRVHESDRPKPKKHVPLFTDATPGFDYENQEVPKRPPHGLGSRPATMGWLND